MMSHTLRISLLIIISFFSISIGQGRNRYRFGLGYTQTALSLFSWGVVMEKEFNRLPIRHQLSLGYIYDNRSNKKYGHGVAIDWILAPCFTVNNYKFGPFFGIGVLLEAFRMKEIDIMYRERDFGITIGGYFNAWEYVSLRIGIMKYFYISKFFVLWNDYPSKFCFSVCFMI